MLISESTDRNQTKSFLDSEGNFLIQKIAYELERTHTVLLPNTQNATSSDLKVLSDKGGITDIALENPSLLKTENGFSTSLSDSGINVTKVEFSISSTTALTQPSIQVSFQISATTSSGQLVTQSYVSTNVLFP